MFQQQLNINFMAQVVELFPNLQVLEAWLVYAPIAKNHKCEPKATFLFHLFIGDFVSNLHTYMTCLLVQSTRKCMNEYLKMVYKYSTSQKTQIVLESIYQHYDQYFGKIMAFFLSLLRSIAHNVLYNRHIEHCEV